MSFMIFLHLMICAFLILTILMQAGRGGGLTEQFAAAESVFGAKANVYLVKTTAVIATLFIVSCVTLAYLSSRQNQSLMDANAAVKKQLDSAKAVAINAEASLPAVPSSSATQPVSAPKNSANPQPTPAADAPTAQ